MKVNIPFKRFDSKIVSDPRYNEFEIIINYVFIK